MSKIIKMYTFAWTNSGGVTYTYDGTGCGGYGAASRVHPVPLTESMFTGRWKEVADSTGKVTIYVEATLPILYWSEKFTTVKHPIFWWRDKEIRSCETKEKTNTIWIPEDHIFFKESWEPEETIYECGG